MNDILKALLGALERGESIAQAAILTHEGSTPRSAGSRMLLASGLITGNGGPVILAGTVGGGLVEAQVMRAGARTLADGLRRVERFDLTGELAAGADMICGGRLTVFLERLEPGDLPLWRELSATLGRGQRVLRLVPQGEGEARLVAPGEPACPFTQAARLAGFGAGRGISAPVALEHEGRSYVLEPWAPASPLVILGAGHVSRPTAQMAALCGFQVTVLDDRAEFASAERFPGAETRVLESYAGCLAGVPTGPEASVVIVTRGHMHDAEALAQALRTSAGYVGMIGSRRKRDAVYQRLRGQGFTEADLARVRCPIGLDIGAETPEEIAVSIVGELVAHRAGKAL